MYLYGIQGIALDWFTLYLTNRAQRFLLMVLFLISVHLNAEYHREQSSALPNFLLTFMTYQTAYHPANLECTADDTHITCVGADVNSYSES